MRALDTGTLLRGRVIVTHYNLITAITITSRLTLLTLLTMTGWAKIYLFFPSDSLNIVFCIYWSEQQCWYSSFNLLRMLKYNQWWQEIIFILNKFPSLLFPQNAFIRTAEAAARDGDWTVWSCNFCKYFSWKIVPWESFLRKRWYFHWFLMSVGRWICE